MKNIFITITFLSIFLVSCSSVPENIPTDLSASELIQLAQSSFDKDNKKAAQAYYEAVIIRFGDNKSVLIEAEYEIAHMKIKEKNWDGAIPDLVRIISYYENDTTRTLPYEYKTLAEIDLAKVPDYALEKAGINKEEL